MFKAIFKFVELSFEKTVFIAISIKSRPKLKIKIINLKKKSNLF